MLTCKLNGRLGNQMFQMASTIGIARRMGYNYGFDRDESYFENPLPKRDNIKYNIANVPWGFSFVVVPDNTELSGYMQSERYFNHIKEDIKYYFKPKKTDEVIPSNAVSVHIRLGDYKGSVKHPVCSKEYYEKAMLLMPEGSNFYLFSDEIDLAREILPGMNIIGGDPLRDLSLMTKFKRHIISNSSFAWWGAWLADGCTVVAPKRWFGTDLSSIDLYCERWKVV